MIALTFSWLGHAAPAGSDAGRTKAAMNAWTVAEYARRPRVPFARATSLSAVSGLVCCWFTLKIARVDRSWLEY
jgi:hypothetical protein